MVHYVADAAHDHAPLCITLHACMPRHGQPVLTLQVEHESLNPRSSKHACLEKAGLCCTYLMPSLVSMHCNNYHVLTLVQARLDHCRTLVDCNYINFEHA